MESDIQRYLKRTRADRHAGVKKRLAAKEQKPKERAPFLLWLLAGLVFLGFWPLGLIMMVWLAFYYGRKKHVDD